MGKVTRTNGVEQYQDVFLRLTDRVNAAGLLRDAIDREIRRTDFSPRQVQQHHQAIVESDDHTVEDVLTRAHSLEDYLELSPLQKQDSNS